MNRAQRLFRPTWVLQLTNAELSDAFEESLVALKVEGTTPRLDVLYNEIERRELAGTWTEDDWKK